jgi:large subunit ribosomal protein L5
MKILSNYYKKIIIYDLINKFNYININQIPKLEKIILNFNCNSFDIKKLSTALLTLELISLKKSRITTATKSNITVKIRKGYPVGCKVILKKEKMFSFLFKLLISIFPELRNFKGLIFKKENKNSFSFTIKDLSNFNELKSNFYLFTNLPALNITLTFVNKSKNEFYYFINSFKLPIK